jgi:hypothetical protein
VKKIRDKAVAMKAVKAKAGALRRRAERRLREIMAAERAAKKTHFGRGHNT